MVKTENKKVLFDDDNEEDNVLHINKEYADRYEGWRLGEEIQKCKNRYGDNFEDEDESSESSSDEDFAEADNPEFDREFLRTMGALQKSDPKLKDASVKFFTADYSKKKDTQAPEKTMTVKDYERIILTKEGGNLDEEEQGVKSEDTQDLSEMKGIQIEDGLKSDEDDSEDDGLLTSGLFKVKEGKTLKEKQEEEAKLRSEEDAFAFIRGECSSLKNEEDRGLLEGLKEEWNDPKKSENEKWLIDFFVNKRYNEEDDESTLRPYNQVIIDEESISDDEKTVEEMETFATKYRFRFEEPDQEFIKRYPRTITDSMRVKDDRRKLQHIETKERKAKKKEIKRQEIERLKALKYKEIEAKIAKIKAASGNEDIDLGEKIFNDEFDEGHYDEVMSQMFNEEYYAYDDGNENKPVFEDDDDYLDLITNYDNFVGYDDSGTYNEDGAWHHDEEQPGTSTGSSHNQRAQAKKTHQQEMIEASSKKGRRRKSRFADAVNKKKPVFNPNEKTFETYYDEYYQLDFEDLIGDMPCRFKYRTVEPNNFGLTTEEILTAQDKELNKWASLKMITKCDTTSHAEEERRKKYSHKASFPHVKQKILPSLFVEDPVQHHISEEEKKRLKNQKKKLRREKKALEMMEEMQSDVTTDQTGPSEPENDATTPTDDKDPAKKKGKKRKRGNAQAIQTETPAGSATSASEDTDQPKKKKKKHSNNAGVEGNNTINGTSNESITSPDQESSKNLKKKKNSAKFTKNETQENSLLEGISDSRLAAYGANPKKIKNKIKYGKKQV